MKKILIVLIAVVMTLTCFAGCNKEEETVTETAYSGILTKVKLGMPLTKIITAEIKMAVPI